MLHPRRPPSTALRDSIDRGAAEEEEELDPGEWEGEEGSGSRAAGSSGDDE